MNTRYRFHPDEYELGETEKFYSDMEARGWQLVKRGAYLSKFVPVKPSPARYRVEVSAPGFLDDQNLPEEQIAVFEECGWKFVTACGLLHVFRAPAGSSVPEFYDDPRQQAATLKKLRRQYVWAWVPTVIILLVNVSLAAAMTRGGPAVLLDRWGTDLQRSWVESTAFCLLLAAVLVWGLYGMVRGAWRVSRTYRRMRRGIPLDHNPTGRRLAHNIVNRTLLALVALCALLTAAQGISHSARDLPERADGPYLLLSDLGWEGKRTYLVYSDNTSQVAFTRSLLAQHWDVREAMELSGRTGWTDQTVWMYQDVYRLSSADMAADFAQTLMEDAVFAHGADAFVPLEIDGLDSAWAAGGLEVVAIRGNMAAYVEYMGLSYEDFDPEALLEALAQRWAVQFQ